MVRRLVLSVLVVRMHPFPVRPFVPHVVSTGIEVQLEQLPFSPFVSLVPGRFSIPFTSIDFVGSSPRGSTQVTQCGLCPGGSFTSPDALADKTLYNPLDITLVYTNQCCATCPANAISQPG